MTDINSQSQAEIEAANAAIQQQLEFENAQQTLIRFINEYRAALVGAYCTYDGKKWDCGEIAKTNIMGANVISLVNGGHLPDNFVWRDYNNNNWPVTSEYMVQLAIRISVFYTEAYQASWQHKLAVMQLTTIDEIFAYDYTSSLWPNPDV